jgi:nitrite reductase/ring-hydroxylating ferredoxin subunit
MLRGGVAVPEPEYAEEGCFEVELADGQRRQVPRFCPHRGGRLAHGELNRKQGTLACPLHRSVFDLRTGEQLAGPACGRLAVAASAEASVPHTLAATLASQSPRGGR